MIAVISPERKRPWYVAAALCVVSLVGGYRQSHTFGRVCSTAELIVPPKGSLVQGCDGLTARVYPPEMPVQADREKEVSGRL